MKKTWILLAAIAVGAAATFLTPSTIQGHKSKLRKAAQPVPNRYLVALKPAAQRSIDEPSESAAGRLVSRFGGAVDKVYSHALQGFSAEMTPEAAAEMSSDPDVLFVEEDSYISVNNTQVNAPWGLDRIDQRNVPLNNAYNYAKTGAGVHVYVIDSGIRATHVEFGGRATRDYDSMYDGQNGNDCHGHGTHVAATIAGSSFGVAKNARVHGIRVVACNGVGTVSAAVEGIDWVTANHISPAVANMSMGSNASALMDVAVLGSINSGVTYVVAAGNSGGDACSVSPARLPNAITVGASDQNDVRASFSNFGSCVDIFAPGVGILSAWTGTDTLTYSASGTSMASPHVAGAVALYLEDHRNSTPSQTSAAVLGGSTNGPVGDTSGSPNLMLFTAPNGPTAANVVVGGRIENAEGRGLNGIRVILQRASDGEMRYTMSNTFGYFQLNDVEVGDLYTLYVQSKRYRFDNSPYSFSLSEDFTSMSFVGVPR